MAILIIHGHPRNNPYPTWLHDSDDDIILLANNTHIESAPIVEENLVGYRHVELLENWAVEFVRERSLFLAQEFSITHIVAHWEPDQELAAELRERLGLPGMLPHQVLPYRDKYVMKQRAQAAGVPVSPFAVADSAQDVRAFAERVGYPLVVKDRTGCGSTGVHILSCAADLEQLSDTRYFDEFDSIVEAFVEGKMCHVDGIVIDGRVELIWPSQYQYMLSTFATDHAPRVDLNLSPDDPLTSRLNNFTTEVLAALGYVGSHAFHAEVFLTPNNDLVLCEIAARYGGAHIREMFHVLFGVDLAELSTRLQASREIVLPELAERVPRRLSAQVLLMRRSGRVQRVPSKPQQPWVYYCDIAVSEGQVVAPPIRSSDIMLAAVVVGPDRDVCASRAHDVGSTFTSELVLQDIA